jgi:monoamine oxidase
VASSWPGILPSFRSQLWALCQVLNCGNTASNFPSKPSVPRRNYRTAEICRHKPRSTTLNLRRMEISLVPRGPSQPWNESNTSKESTPLVLGHPSKVGSSQKEFMKNSGRVVVVGAGACGLMCAWELGKAGKKVVILEARDRIGGRVFPLSKQEFGYPAEGGAEFVHGKAKLTRSLIDAAGLHYVAIEGETWRREKGKLIKEGGELLGEDLFVKALNYLKHDIPVTAFLSQHFGGERYASLRDSVLNLVSGYDAADPTRASTFGLRAELLEQDASWQQGRIREGYGALIDFLAAECRRCGGEIHLNCEVKSIQRYPYCCVRSEDGQCFQAEQVVLTLPLPVITSIDFSPGIPEKLKAISRMGFGQVVKILIRFRERWWTGAGGKNLTNLTFLFSDGAIPTWWTQHPEAYPVLTGWVGGPRVENFRGLSSERIVSIALGSLSTMFGIQQSNLEAQCLSAIAPNWSRDPFTRGAYSYATTDSAAARLELSDPVNDCIFFGGEAFAEGPEASTVEGALMSGRYMARKILST